MADKQTIMFRRVATYGIKDFGKDMGLPKYVTARGIIKRLSRQYPRAYSIASFGLALSMTLTLSLAVIPGCIIPGQKQYKKFLINKYTLHDTEYNGLPIYGSWKAHQSDRKSVV